MFSSVQRKLLFSFLGFGLIPMFIVVIIAHRATGRMEHTQLVQVEAEALHLADKIERNLSERYSDVQAFCLNQVIQNTEEWYRFRPEENDIVRVMNAYVDAYDVYYLTLLVDLEGRLIAVNSTDQDGNPIETRSLYRTNFSDREWFKKCKSGVFTTEMAFTAPENRTSTGTFIEGLHIDPEVKAIYGDHDTALTLGFSAPAYNERGEIIGVWSNRTKFSLVEEIFLTTYSEIKKAFVSTELTLLDEVGNVIVDYDPALGKGDEHRTSHDFENVLFKLNLADLGVASAVEAVAGNTGSLFSVHARKKIVQASGFTHLKGALGYPGMSWSVLVRIAKSEFSKEVDAAQRLVLVACGGVIAMVLILGLIAGKRAARPLRETAAILEDIATGEGDLTKRLVVCGKDEIGQIAYWFNTFQDRLVDIIKDIAGNAENLDASAGALGTVSEQLQQGVTSMSSLSEEAAASTEASSQNVQTIAAGIEESSSNANTVSTAAEEVSANLSTVSASVEEMSSTMQGIAGTVENTTSAVNSVSVAIEELSTSLCEVAGSTEQASGTAQEAAAVAATTSKVVNKLGDSAQEIGKVVDVISGIAAQTNLLALNATIEAASAGEAGKGFAVVANEVKELAKQTANATGDISDQVEGMQSDTAAAVKAIGEIVAVIGQMNEVFGTIAATVDEQNATVNEIAKNVGEAARSAEEMSHNVQDTAAGTVEVSKNVQEATLGVNDITRSIAELAAGFNKIAESAGQTTRDMGEVLESITGVNRATLEAKDNANVVNSSTQALSDLASRLKQVVEQFKF